MHHETPYQSHLLDCGPILCVVCICALPPTYSYGCLSQSSTKMDDLHRELVLSVLMTVFTCKRVFSWTWSAWSYLVSSDSYGVWFCIGLAEKRTLSMSRLATVGKTTDQQSRSQISYSPSHICQGYAIDVIARQQGHEVIRTPSYHPELQPMEMRWGILKNEVARHCDFTLENLKRQLQTYSALRHD